ncbi:MAG TPA: hypothetical protein VKQ30_16780 [Ktedonobacterales bacterium]|jgi:hypothetical protein|nr:hypothetical protein [Ktedonobacterales bacterium]
MQPWESGIHVTSQPEAASTELDDFTSDEKERLLALCQHFSAHPEYLESGIDERRLTFARWLVDHGKLSENL